MKPISLNGLWDFIFELDPKYHRSAEPAYAGGDWGRKHWQKVTVPGVWNKYAEKLDLFEGVCWFCREFTVDSLPEKAEALLRFGAVNYYCRVFLNARLVGEHEGGYTEFTLDVSKDLKEGKNFLAVEVDNRASITKLPAVFGYFNYGGIHRDVSLEIHPEAHLKEVFVDGRPEGDSAGTLRVRGIIKKAVPELKVSVTCQGVTGELKLTSERQKFDLRLKIPRITPWTPETPVCYPVKIKLENNSRVFDELSLETGFRRIVMRDGKILLNGKPVFLKGICYLYDSPAYGLVMKPEQYLEDIALLKESGVNTIRSHFPFTHEFYLACDRAGIMVWVETPVYCLHPKTEARHTIFSNPDINRLARSMVREMVLSGRNHPSIIIYSTGNECNVENAEAKTFFAGICREIRQLDDTRLLSYASLYCNVGPLAEMVDILGINEYWGWYDKIYGGKGLEPEQEAKQKRVRAKLEPINLKILDDKLNELKRKYKKPMLLTEFGADSLPGYFSSSRNLWSEEYHADLLKETLAITAKHPEICGVFPFCFNDYRDPSKYVNNYWDYMNYKGLVSYQRRPKKAFYVLKTTYRQKD